MTQHITPGQVRIIGGQWRGRKLKVPPLPHLRPTPNRIRETLFNWLAPVIVGARCLDPFSGSGALGFEALSRGARFVTLTDLAPMAVASLQASLLSLQSTQADIYCAKAPEQLKKPTEPFDIVFLDPPFQQNLLLPCCFYLEENNFLADTAYIYLEAEQTLTEQDLPPHWQLIKCKRAGQVSYHLALRTKTG